MNTSGSYPNLITDTVVGIDSLQPIPRAQINTITVT